MCVWILLGLTATDVCATEQITWDSFIQGDYDDAMRMLTLRDAEQHLLGYVIWLWRPCGTARCICLCPCL